MEDSQEQRLQRMTPAEYRPKMTWILLACVGLFAAIGVAAAIFGASGPVPILATTGSAVIAVMLAVVWYRPLSLSPLLAVLALSMICAVVVGTTAPGSETAFATVLPFAFLTVWQRPWWLPAGCAAVTVALLIPAASATPADAPFGPSLLFAGVIFGAQSVAFLGANIGWRMLVQLDQYRSDQNELSLARERLRFATDLHDIQGHTLLAVKMKAELARRSLDRNPEVARRELADVESLVAETASRTRELAHGYRDLTLPAELANLRELFAAAGIRIDVHRAKDAAPFDPVFASLVREAASNILRHADPTRVAVTVTEHALTIRNDGASPADGDTGGTGLVSLRQRFEQAGGTLAWTQDNGTFTVTGTPGDRV